MAEKNIFDEWGFRQSERDLISKSATGNTGDANYAKVLSTMILAKQIKSSTIKIVDSNKELSDAENLHSKKMAWLTAALVFVGITQVIAIFIQIYLNQNSF
jgi:hypothetical protein